jgi:hypothetical protein
MARRAGLPDPTAARHDDARHPAATKAASEPQLSPSQDVGVDVCIMSGAWISRAWNVIWRRFAPVGCDATCHRNK